MLFDTASPSQHHVFSVRGQSKARVERPYQRATTTQIDNMYGQRLGEYIKKSPLNLTQSGVKFDQIQLTPIRQRSEGEKPDSLYTKLMTVDSTVNLWLLVEKRLNI